MSNAENSPKYRRDVHAIIHESYVDAESDAILTTKRTACGRTLEIQQGTGVPSAVTCQVCQRWMTNHTGRPRRRR